jgi:hypothetical protein
MKLSETMQLFFWLLKNSARRVLDSDITVMELLEMEKKVEEGLESRKRGDNAE